jgi:hypothetical protein
MTGSAVKLLQLLLYGVSQGKEKYANGVLAQYSIYAYLLGICLLNEWSGLVRTDSLDRAALRCLKARSHACSTIVQQKKDVHCRQKVGFRQ